MTPDPRKARDLALLDSIDNFQREPLHYSVWRVTREGRDPLQGARSRSRWCNDSFDILYASLEKDGALAEAYALLSSQPVFPSRVNFFVHRISIRLFKALRLPDMATLDKLGVDVTRYRERVYHRTQDIADAAYFLDFDGLIAPSARWNCHALALFTDRILPENIELTHSDQKPIDWLGWRRGR